VVVSRDFEVSDGRTIRARDDAGWLFSRVGLNAREAFPFMGERYERVAREVLARFAEIDAQPRKLILRTQHSDETRPALR
jgi:hypothetical protein